MRNLEIGAQFPDSKNVQRNLEIGMQFLDSKNAQCNLEIAHIPKLHGTNTLQERTNFNTNNYFFTAL